MRPYTEVEAAAPAASSVAAETADAMDVLRRRLSELEAAAQRAESDKAAEKGPYSLYSRVGDINSRVGDVETKLQMQHRQLQIMLEGATSLGSASGGSGRSGSKSVAADGKFATAEAARELVGKVEEVEARVRRLQQRVEGEAETAAAAAEQHKRRTGSTLDGLACDMGELKQQQQQQRARVRLARYCCFLPRLRLPFISIDEGSSA